MCHVFGLWWFLVFTWLLLARESQGLTCYKCDNCGKPTDNSSMTQDCSSKEDRCYVAVFQMLEPGVYATVVVQGCGKDSTCAGLKKNGKDKMHYENCEDCKMQFCNGGPSGMIALARIIVQLFVTISLVPFSGMVIK